MNRNDEKMDLNAMWARNLCVHSTLENVTKTAIAFRLIGAQDNERETLYVSEITGYELHVWVFIVQHQLHLSI